jgi:hypothetical protein
LFTIELQYSCNCKLIRRIKTEFVFYFSIFALVLSTLDKML